MAPSAIHEIWELIRKGEKGGDKTGLALKEFFTMLAVCHSVMVEVDPKDGKLKFQASSPDELALVAGAQ